MEFQYYLPVNLVFGRGSVAKIGNIAVDYGKKALIVTGHSSTKKSGLLDRIIRYLEKSGIESVVFDKVKQNPLTTTAEEAAEDAAEDAGCSAAEEAMLPEGASVPLQAVSTPAAEQAASPSRKLRREILAFFIKSPPNSIAVTRFIVRSGRRENTLAVQPVAACVHPAHIEAPLCSKHMVGQGVQAVRIVPGAAGKPL